MPHRELMQLYREASVFVLPSLADGFGMVITEAMSRGLPVIATDHTGALDLIDHGRSGFVLPAGDVQALCAQMRWCVEHSEELLSIGARAIEAATRWQWSDYQRALCSTIRRRLDAHLQTNPGDLVRYASFRLAHESGR
jgi:glycosyltransferase involved in cell wall biosynthesis